MKTPNVPPMEPARRSRADDSDTAGFALPARWHDPRVTDSSLARSATLPKTPRPSHGSFAMRKNQALAASSSVAEKDVATWFG